MVPDVDYAGNGSEVNHQFSLMAMGNGKFLREDFSRKRFMAEFLRDIDIFTSDDKN